MSFLDDSDDGNHDHFDWQRWWWPLSSMAFYVNISCLLKRWKAFIIAVLPAKKNTETASWAFRNQASHIT